MAVNGQTEPGDAVGRASGNEAEDAGGSGSGSEAEDRVWEVGVELGDGGALEGQLQRLLSEPSQPPPDEDDDPGEGHDGHEKDEDDEAAAAAEQGAGELPPAPANVTAKGAALQEKLA